MAPRDSLGKPLPNQEISMHIDIAARMRPFSHLPGTSCLVPGSPWQITVYPALIRIYDLRDASARLLKEIPLPVKGPVSDFTVMMDLEQGFVRVQGLTPAGFMRYRVICTDRGKGVVIVSEKEPEGTSLFGQKEMRISLQGDPLSGPVFNPPPLPRLSLGCHKKADWPMVLRRLEMTEIFPVWHRLGLLTPETAPHSKGTAALFQECSEIIAESRNDKIIAAFRKAFLAAFHSLLVPRLVDDDYQGLTEGSADRGSESPLWLIKGGAELIHRLFIKSEGRTIEILPSLPPELFSGRLIDVFANPGVSINLEWSKKQLRRMILKSGVDAEVLMLFQRDVKTFRLRTNDRDPGRVVTRGELIKLHRNEMLLFDRFEQ